MDLLLKFKDYLTQGKNQPSKATVKNYIADLRKFIRWYEAKYERLFHPLAISPAVLEEYKTEVNDARSLKRYLSSLRKFFQYLYQLGAIPANPLDQQLAQKTQEANPWRLKDFKRFLYTTKASKLTIKNYTIDVRQFVEWLKEVISSEAAIQSSGKSLNVTESDVYARIDAATVEEYKKRMLTQRQLSPVSINRKLSSLRKYIAWLHEKNIIQKDVLISDLRSPIAAIAAPEELPVEEPATLEELREVTNIATKEQQVRGYSKFPPLRLFQKSTKAISLTLDLLILLPIIRLVASGKYTFWKLRGGQVFAPVSEVMTASLKGLDKATQKELQVTPPTKIARNSTRIHLIANTITLFGKLAGTANMASKAPHISNLPKSMYAPLKMSTKNMPLFKKILFHLKYTRPNWYKRYHSYPVARYFNMAIFLILTTSIGFGLYQSFFEKPHSQKPALAALPNSPPRILSFQGRLTDSSDTPITAATNLRFAIYDSQSASGSALLWEEVQHVTPDQDGIFSALLGKTNAISQSLFANNSSLYMGVTVGTDSELQPRQQLATVAYAANAETLQGLVPITQADAGTTNVVLALDSAGNLSIGGTASPTFEAPGGTFTLSGQTLNLTTTQGSNGNIQLAPDGTGIIDLQKPLQNTTNGIIQVNSLLAVSANTNLQSALTINQNGAGSIISASSGGIAKFVVDNHGAGTFADTLTINGNTLTTGSTTFNLLPSNASTVNFAGAATALSIASTSGTTTVNNTLNVTGQLNANGGANIPSGKTLTVSGTISSNLIPSSSSTYDIGAYANYWREAFLTNLFMAPSATNSGFWQRNNGALAPTNISDDLLIGANNSSAAKFQIFAASGNATTAGTLTFNTTGTIQTTNSQTFTLGGSTTGNILLQPQNGSGRVGVGTANPLATLDVNGSASVSGNLTLNSVGTIQTTGNQLLTLGGNTTGNITLSPLNGSGVVSINGSLGVGTANPLAKLDIRGSNGTLPVASVSGQTTAAALIVDNSGSGDLFTASSAGATKLRLDNSGNLLPGSNDAQNIGSAQLNWNTVFTNNVIPGNPSGVQGFWQRNGNALSPYNSTDDILLGSTATGSAKIGLINMAGGTPTATLSAGTTGLSLAADGSIQTLNNGSLTLGGNTTGNITLSPLNGAGTVTSTGTFNLASGKTYQIAGTDVLSATTLGTGVLNSSLTTVGALTSGSIATGFGTISTGNTITTTSTITGDTINASTGTVQTAGTNRIDNSGNLTNIGTTQFNTQTYSWPAGGQANGYFLTTDGSGALTWTDIANSSSNYWRQANGALSSANSTVDLLIGGTSTASAKFAVLNMAAGTPTATLSAGTTGVSLAADGSIQTLNNGSLTLGGNTTGNILLNPLNGAGYIGPSTNNVTDLGTATVAFRTIYAATDIKVGGSSVCLSSGTNCPTAASFWDQINGALYADNPTVDFLLGGASSSSAKFAVLNVNSGTPTATLSAGTTGLSLAADGSIQTLNNGSLTLGGNTTGNITLSPLNGAGTVTSTGTFNLASGKTYQIAGTDVLSATTLGTGITASSLTSVGTLTSGTWNATAIGTQYGGTGQNFSAIAQGAIPYFSGTGVMNALAAGSVGQCLITNGAGADPSWGTCGSGGSGNYWIESGGTLYPANTNEDVLIGGTATNSAKFGFINVAQGTPTATISAGATGLAFVGNGSIQSLNNGSLTLGGNTTGNILLNPLNGAGYIGPSTNNVTDLGTATVAFRTIYAATDIKVGGSSVCLSSGTNCPAGTVTYWDQANGALSPKNSTVDLFVGGTSSSSATFHAYGAGPFQGTNPSASISARSSFAALVVDNAGSGDIFTASSSGLNRFVIKQNGNVGIGTALPTDKMEVSGNIASGTRLSISNTHATSEKSELFFKNNSVAQGWAVGTDYLASGTDDFYIWGGGTGNSRLYINSSGSMAIGTGHTNPLATLDIRGNSGTTPVSSISGQTSSAALVVDNRGSGDLFTASSSGLNRFVITQNGNVGINITKPSNSLVISTIGSNALLNGYNGSISGGIDYAVLQATSLGGSIAAGLERPLIFQPNGNASGTVGIGTTAPIATLDIRGNSATTPAASVSANSNLAAFIVDQRGNADIFTASTGGVSKFTINNSGTITTSNYRVAGGLFYADANGVFQQTAAGTGSQCLLGGTTPTWGSCGSGTNYWQLNNGALSPFSNTLDLFAGGTSSSSATFHAYGAGPFQGTNPSASISARSSFAALVVDNRGTGDIFTASSSGLNRFVISQNGNVGIGTTKPSNRLQLLDNTAGSFAVDFENASTTGYGQFVFVNHASSTIDALLVQGINGGNSITGLDIKGNGSVGIGTTSPLATLDLRGNSATTPAASVSANSNFAAMLVDNRGSGDLFAASSSGLTRFVIKQNGNIGIGTGNPQEMLHISGATASGGNNAVRLRLANTGVGTTKSEIEFAGSSNWFMGTDVNGAGGDNFFIYGGGAGSTRLKFDANGSLTLGGNTANRTAVAALDVKSTSGTQAAGYILGQTSFAALAVENTGVGDLFTASASGVSKFVITQNGEVGIGTGEPGTVVGPQGLLHVNQSSNATVVDLAYFTNNNGQAGSGVNINFATYNGYTNGAPATFGVRDNNYGEDFVWLSKIQGAGSNAQQENMRLTADGKLGVNTASPDTTVKIVGSLCVKSTDTACAGSVAGRIYASNTTVQSADLAENYISGESLEPGDIVMPEGNGNNQAVVKTTKAYQSQAIGIISTDPGVTLNSGALTDTNHPNLHPIALQGRVPVKVSTINGVIHAGDLLTSSSIPGVAMKATSAGQIIGKALEDYTNTQEVGKITSFVNISYADPEADLAATGDLTVFALGTNPMTGNPTYGIHDANGYLFTKIIDATQATIANLTAGIVNAQDITIAGQTLEHYITSIVSQITGGHVSTDTTNTNLISSTASNSAIALGIEKDKLVIHADKDASSAAVASIDNEGNASFSGTLRVKKIIADEIEGSTIKTGTLAATYITNVTNIYNSIATPSATPTPTSSGSASLPPTSLNNNYADLASMSASLTADFGKFNQGLMVLGPTSMTDATVSNQLSIGSNMTIADNSINTIGADLNIQPFKQGNISFMGGAVTIDTDGNVNYEGNAVFAQNVKIKGTLAAHVISPVPDEDLIVQLSDDGNGNHNKFAVQNEQGDQVLSINHLGDVIASGSGKFAGLATNALNIVRGAQADTSITETVASGSAGFALIKANETERTIYSPYVKENSLIYVTATSNTQGQVPYVARQTEEDPAHHVKGSFTVQIPINVARDIKFNWWIVN